MSFMLSWGAKTRPQDRWLVPCISTSAKGRMKDAELCVALLIGRADRGSPGHVCRGGGGDADRLGAVSDRRRTAADPPRHRPPPTDAVRCCAPATDDAVVITH